MTTPAPDELTALDVRRLAIDWLPRREYSRLELHRKLSTKTPDQVLIDQVMEELAGRNWQSDERFCAAFIRSRLSRGVGPLRIRQELILKGIPDDLLRPQLAEVDIDWFEKALLVAEKKISSLGRDPKWREKLYRFLMYRGFDSDQARYALEAIKNPL